jgi:hypothetical protein
MTRALRSWQQLCMAISTVTCSCFSSLFGWGCCLGLYALCCFLGLMEGLGKLQ